MRSAGCVIRASSWVRPVGGSALSMARSLVHLRGMRWGARMAREAVDRARELNGVNDGRHRAGPGRHHLLRLHMARMWMHHDRPVLVRSPRWPTRGASAALCARTSGVNGAHGNQPARSGLPGDGQLAGAEALQRVGRLHRDSVSLLLEPSAHDISHINANY